MYFYFYGKSIISHNFVKKKQQKTKKKNNKYLYANIKINFSSSLQKMKDDIHLSEWESPWRSCKSASR